MKTSFCGVDMKCRLNGKDLAVSDVLIDENQSTGRVKIKFAVLVLADEDGLVTEPDIMGDIQFILANEHGEQMTRFFSDMKRVSSNMAIGIDDDSVWKSYEYSGFICKTTVPPRKWLIHNLIGHPVSGILECLGMNKLADLVHDKTLPRL
jgi:hypothetical protein